MFNMDDDVLLTTGIKVIDGIAGGGKSSKIDAFFRSNGIPYDRFTSTNRLRRDAMDRFGMDVKTVAAGLFNNSGSHFYTSEKDPSSKYIVIDEILQTSPKAVEWCLNHAETTDIIITTDSKQLLSPENEDEMIKAFEKLKTSEHVIYRNVEETLRPRNNKTKKIYHQLYDNADAPIKYTCNEIADTFTNVIYYEDMIYTTSDAYITHDNATEDFLYKDHNFATNPALDLVPKGYLASRPPKDLTRYPLLSQLSAQKSHVRSYTQVMNVGTPVRFQGSEVDDTHKLYYILQPTSIVSARELYTVITRLWDIDSLVIVLANTPKPFSISTFNGKPVKTHKYLVLNEEKEPEELTQGQMNKLVSAYDTEEIYYDREIVRNYRGNVIYSKSGKNTDGFKKKQVTAGSIARRDAALQYSYMDKVYSILDEHGLLQISSIIAERKKHKYQMDLASAYPTMLKYGKVPVDGILESDHPHDDMMNFYYFEMDKDLQAELHFSRKGIVTDDLANYLTEHNYGTCTYLFSTPYSDGCVTGDWLYKNTHDTIERKAEIKKAIHYGYYQKPYLQYDPDTKCYVKYEAYIYQLLMCHIFSQLLYHMMLVKDKINAPSLYVDAVQFDEYNESMVDDIKSVLPSYFDFTIEENKTLDTPEVTLYTTSKPLPSKKDKLAEQKRNWQNNMTEEQRAHRNELRRKRYAEKKGAKLS